MFRRDFALLALVLTTAVAVFAADPPQEPAIKLDKARCPVAGGAVSKEFHTTYKRGEVYFTDAAALAKFQAEKSRYAAQANLQLFATQQYEQSACPLTGRRLSSKFVSIEGVQVYVCCQNCVTISANAKQADQLKFFFGNQSFDRQFRVAAKK